jgi:hypothetical protein
LTKGKIGSGQLLLLLFASRCFNLLDYIPAFNQPEEYTAVLLGNLTGLVLQALLLIPPLLLYRRFQGENLILAAGNRWRPLGWCFGLLYLAAIVSQLAGTLIGFEYFMTSTIYPGASGAFFILTMAPACFWCGRNGLEGTARAGAIVSVFLLLSLGTIFLISLRSWDVRNLHPLLGDPLPAVWQGTLQSLSKFPELYLLILLYPQVRGSTVKCSYGLIAAAFLLFEAAGLLLTGVLGEYAMSQTFPYYTLAAVVDTELIQRLDSLYMLNWVLSAFIRCTLLVIVGKECARDFLPARAHPLVLPVLLALSCLLALLGCRFLEQLGELSRSSSNGLITALFCGGLPLLLLLITGRRKKAGAE